MTEPKKLDPNKLKKGDKFRGKHWRYGANHIFKGEIIDNRWVEALCNKWFEKDEIHEPLPEHLVGDADDLNLCMVCSNRSKKE